MTVDCVYIVGWKGITAELVPSGLALAQSTNTVRARVRQSSLLGARRNLRSRMRGLETFLPPAKAGAPAAAATSAAAGAVPGLGRRLITGITLTRERRDERRPL
jgi:hypothetical protein